ncbi:ATP-binding protein [Streptomyces sp. AA1529]|uniref:ATP-binding protein n=1 Tax=Streptomyces sp. AA1529 TaxID=1203257 RepID=UPI000373AF88|nr:ATP-binding protein [Streptomyces sp. AA1529]
MSGRTNIARFRLSKASVPRAREHVRLVLREWKLGHLCDEAALVVSELTTNAVTHAAQGIGDQLELVLRRRGGVLVLEVSDAYRGAWRECPVLEGGGDIAPWRRPAQSGRFCCSM